MLVRYLLPLLAVSLLPAQGKKARADAPRGGMTFSEFPVPDAAPLSLDAATKQAVAELLALQEGDEREQWPYEGVYREDGGKLPVGYRVGGTSLTCMGMVAAPGYRKDAKRQEAVARAVAFVLDTLGHDRMQIGFEGGYDVRGWGHIYALTMLLHLRDARLVPKGMEERVEEKTGWLVEALVETAIPQTGGWNYSRRRGYKKPGNAASTFMTAPALQALFHAKARGYEVPDEVVEQALGALDRARSAAGGFAYSAPRRSRSDVGDDELHFMDKTPGAAARAAVIESTFLLAGRGDKERHEKATRLFFEQWDELAKRKSQLGTHNPPYGIAPYYFMFGHIYAAQAVELLDDAELKGELRGEMRRLLAKSREQNGTWNDRQFPRSAGYGTACALMTLYMQRLPKPHAWQPTGASDDGAAEKGAGK